MNRFVYASPASRRALAQWLALVPAGRAESILRAAGASSVRCLHPGHFPSVVNAVKAELARAKPVSSPVREGGAVSLSNLADVIATTVVDIRRRGEARTEAEEREHEERLAPFRATVEDAAASYRSACVACDEAEAETNAAYNAMVTAVKASDAAFRKAERAQDGRTHTREQFDVAVAAYDRANAVYEGAEAAYAASQNVKAGAYAERRKAQQVLSDAHAALESAT